MGSSARIDELRKKFDENPRRYFAPLANEYRKAGDLEQAIFICQEYLPQQPGHMSGHIVYGQALFELSRHDEARAVFETALSLDPENLIALRHLGDISREAGDLKGARAWYQRVLEADPRNEEIAQLMLTVLTTPADGQDAVATSVNDSAAADPIAMPAVAPTETGAFESAFGVEKSSDGDLNIGAPLSELAPPQFASAPEPEPRRSREAIPEDELLDLNDFSVGGTPLSSLVVPAEPQANVAPAPEEPFPIAGIQESFEADPFAIAHDDSEDNREERVAPPVEPLATDIILGRLDDGTAPDALDAASTSALDGLESFSESGYGLNGGESTPSLEVESFYEMPPVTSAEPIADAGELVESSQHEPLSFERIESETVGFESTFAEADEVTQVVPQDSAEFDVVESEPAAFEAAEPEPIVFERHEAEPIAYEPVAADAVEPAPVLESAPGTELEPGNGGHTDAFEDAVSSAFVTETMAELYQQQGHLEAALDIYRQLSEQRPEDEALRDRIKEVEELLLSTASPSENTVAPVATGPTIREFLASILQGRLSATAAAEPTTMESIEVDFAPEAEAEPESTPIEESSFEESYGLAMEDSTAPVVEAPREPTFEESPFEARTLEIVPPMFSQPSVEPEPATLREPRFTPTASETVTGSIDALFSGADASASDSDAASMLAEAFGAAEPDANPLDGVPAHRAPNELSLDHVFKSSVSPRPDADGDGFSFDQFFADDLSEAASRPGAEQPSANAHSSDDIAQFNNWLNGLKKT